MSEHQGQWTGPHETHSDWSDSGENYFAKGGDIIYTVRGDGPARILAALNAAEQAEKRDELLKRVCMILKRCEGPVADTVDEHSATDGGGLTLRLIHDWLAEYAALTKGEE